MCERNMSWLPLAWPQQGTWPATPACVLTGNRTTDLWVHRPALNPLSPTSQGRFYLFSERGQGEKGGGTSIGCLSHAPSWGPGPQPRHMS